MRAWAGDDLARESAEVLYTYWDLADPADDELRAEVLSRFSPAEPPAVPGLDFLAVEADAKTIVAEVVAGPKLRTFEDAHGCAWRENGEWLTLLDADGKDSGLNKTPAFVEQHYGPLVEVTP